MPYCLYLEAISTRWSSAHAATLLDRETARYLLPRFARCSTPMKVRILLSFLYLTAEPRMAMRADLLKIARDAEVDRDEWVRKLARLVEAFIIHGSLDVRETDTESAFAIIKFLDEQKLKHKFTYRRKPPLETPYMANVKTEGCMLVKGESSHQRIPSTSTPEDSITGTVGPDSRQMASFGWRHLVLDRHVVDNENFAPQIDFLAFSDEIIEEGEQVMRKAWLSQQSSRSGN